MYFDYFCKLQKYAIPWEKGSIDHDFSRQDAPLTYQKYEVW